MSLSPGEQGEISPTEAQIPPLIDLDPQFTAPAFAAWAPRSQGVPPPASLHRGLFLYSLPQLSDQNRVLYSLAIQPGVPLPDHGQGGATSLL